MKVEIEQTSSNPANTLLNVYDGGLRPICAIWEEDFAELLTDSQIKKLETGQFKFDINKNKLFELAKTIY